MWLIAGGIGALCVVAAVCVWTVIVLLAEAGVRQDAAADDPGTDGAHEPDGEPRLESAVKRKQVHNRADRY